MPTLLVSTDEESAPSPDFGSPFDSEQDEAPDPVLSAYDFLCPGGAARDADECMPVADPAAADLPAVDPPAVGPPAKKKRRKRGSTSFRKKKGVMKDVYTPVSPSSRKRRTRQTRQSMPDASQWGQQDCSTLPQRKMRDCISLFYLTVLCAPPPEDWHGEGGTVSQIARALRLKKSQKQQIINVIAKTHHAMITGE